MVQWSWKVRHDGNIIFGLGGQEVWQQVIALESVGSVGIIDDNT